MAASSGGKGGGHVPQGVDGRRQAPNRGLPQLQEAVGGGDHRSMVSPMSKSKEELEVENPSRHAPPHLLCFFPLFLPPFFLFVVLLSRLLGCSRVYFEVLIFL